MPTAPPASAVRPGGTETILVAEDDAAVRSVAARTLQSLGYRVLEAGHGAEALEIAAAHAECIHLLVTDVVMPHVNGKVLADELRRARPELKVLFTSGYPAEAFGKAGFRSGRTSSASPTTRPGWRGGSGACWQSGLRCRSGALSGSLGAL